MSTLRPAEPGGKRITGVGVLDRSVALLDLLADGPRTLRWLADASGLPRPDRLPPAGRAGGAPAGRPGRHRARSGSARGWPSWPSGPAPRWTWPPLAGPVLARLHEATGESVQLYVRSGDRRLCVAARDAGTGLRDSVPVGALLPLDVGSGGKVLLAWSPDALHPSSPARRRPGPDATHGPMARSPAGRPVSWAAELAAVRKRGWAASVAEREPGVASVSAPVLADGQLLGALCVSGPASRIGQAPGKRLAPLVVQAAADLARLAHPT